MPTLVAALSQRVMGLPLDVGQAVGGDSVGYAVTGMITRQAAMIGYLNVFDLLFLMSLAMFPVCLVIKGSKQPA